MGLRDPFALRIATIRAFLDVPPTRVLELLRPPDLEILLARTLARIADEASDPHAWLYLRTPFVGYREFLDAIADGVDASVGSAAAELAQLDISMPHPPVLDPADEPWPWTRATAEYLSAVAEGMPVEAGALVLVIETDEVSNPAAVGWVLGGLALALRSDRVKIIATHEPGRWTPDSEELRDRVLEVDFAVSPGELEAEVQADLSRGGLSPEDERRHRLLAGAFATGAGRFDEAERHLRQVLADTGDEALGAERGNALYNLGNLYGRTGRHAEASETLVGGAESALEAGNDGLAAMCLTNLGVSLYHEGRGEEAVAALGAARRLFRAMNHRPGEAHVVDCTARVWVASDRARARALWLEAVEIYDSIEAPHMAEVRVSGRTDVLDRLARLDADASAG